MTIAEEQAARPGTDRGDRRELARHDLAEALEFEPARLPDGARFADDLCLDSLTMMVLLTWLETRGVVVGSADGLPATVGDVLSMVERAASPRLSVHVGGRSSTGPAAGVPPLPGTAPAAPLAPVLSNQVIRLTTVSPDDIRFLYTLAVNPETGFRWRYRGSPPSIDRFMADLWAQVLVQYVARRVETNEPVGHVVCYGADMGMGYAYVGAVFQAAYAGTGLAAQAATMFVRSLFHVYPLRKVYLEIPGFNWPQMSSGEGRLFTVEGVLRGHEVYAGTRWDRYICAVYRDGVSDDGVI